MFFLFIAHFISEVQNYKVDNVLILLLQLHRVEPMSANETSSPECRDTEVASGMKCVHAGHFTGRQQNHAVV